MMIDHSRSDTVPLLAVPECGMKKDSTQFIKKIPFLTEILLAYDAIGIYNFSRTENHMVLLFN